MHTFTIPGLSPDFAVVRFEGREGLSELFEFDITVAAEAAEVVFDDVIGMPAALGFSPGGQLRRVHGIIASFEQADQGKKLTTYRAVLVPEVWRLLHRQDTRIFQGLSVPDIVKEVLDAGGIARSRYRLALRGSYAVRDYCVQYRESDWAFISRLLEDEGIAYHFEHGEDSHALVLSDASAAFEPIAGERTVPFRPSLGALASGDHVSRFRFGGTLVPGKVTLRDYDFKRPSLSLEATESAPRGKELEIYDQPGNYDALGGGEAKAKIRLEELRAAERLGRGESACARLSPGATFVLTDHGRDDFNREYLLIRVTHQGHEPQMDTHAGDTATPYENRFQVIPSGVPFRPPRVTARPRIRGVQTAIVSGPAGEEIYTDEHGRIKVHFHWDRLGRPDEHSSCWIRVSQSWAGGAWGALFLPRVGHEVVVDFVEGDPDRPLVVGSVYHGANVPPYALPAERTKSTIKSSSSKGGRGSNEIRLEDRKGAEELFLHAEKDWNVAVEDDASLHVGHDRRERVDNDESESVGGHKRIDTAKTHTESIGEDERLSVGGDRSVSVSKDHTESVGGCQSISVDKDRSESVGGASRESVAKSKSVSVDEEYSLTVAKNGSIKIGKDLQEEVGEKRTVIVGEQLAVQCGDATIVVKKNGDITVQGKKITVKGDGPISVEGKKLSVKCQGDVSVQASGKVNIKGSQVGIN